MVHVKASNTDIIQQFPNETEAEYKRARHELQKSIRAAKRPTLKSFEGCYLNNNMHRIWQGIEAVTNCRGTTTTTEPRDTPFQTASTPMPGLTDWTQTRPQRPHVTPHTSSNSDVCVQRWGTWWSSSHTTEGLWGTTSWCVHWHLQPVTIPGSSPSYF